MNATGILVTGLSTVASVQASSNGGSLDSPRLFNPLISFFSIKTATTSPYLIGAKFISAGDLVDGIFYSREVPIVFTYALSSPASDQSLQVLVEVLQISITTSSAKSLCDVDPSVSYSRENVTYGNISIADVCSSASFQAQSFPCCYDTPSVCPPQYQNPDLCVRDISGVPFRPIVLPPVLVDLDPPVFTCQTTSTGGVPGFSNVGPLVFNLELSEVVPTADLINRIVRNCTVSSRPK